MEVILLERIENLGQMGDVVNVKPGYARNFLLPRKKALRATEDNRRHFENQRAQLETQNLENRSEAEKVGARLDGLVVSLIRQAGEAGQLYGSVNARDIADDVTAAGFTVSRQQVRLEHPIKALGLYEVTVSLHPEVTVTVTANVARSVEEAEVQAKTGKAVVRADEEEAVAETATGKPRERAAAEEKAAPDLSDLVEEGVELPDEVTGETTEEETGSEKADTGETK